MYVHRKTSNLNICLTVKIKEGKLYCKLFNFVSSSCGEITLYVGGC